jgi:hypothetical protein
VDSGSRKDVRQFRFFVRLNTFSFSKRLQTDVQISPVFLPFQATVQNSGGHNHCNGENEGNYPQNFSDAHTVTERLND